MIFAIDRMDEDEEGRMLESFELVYADVDLRADSRVILDELLARTLRLENFDLRRPPRNATLRHSGRPPR